MSIAEQDANRERVEAAEEISRPQHAAATVVAAKMFRFSRFVHVGPDAEECPLAVWTATAPGEERAAEMPTCSNPEHFHAWIRLPNKFQHGDIHAKALAAKARKIRTLRDAESDAAVVMEAEIDELRSLGDVELLIDELMAADWSRDYLSALGDVGADEQWEHIDQDREEFERLLDVEGIKPEDERTDEFRALERRLEAYRDAIHARLAEIQKPAREGLADKGLDALVDMVRDGRVLREGDRAFLQTYNKWTWLSGTMTVEEHSVTKQHTIPYFSSVDVLEGAAPEIIDALGQGFQELEAEIQQGVPGNS